MVDVLSPAVSEMDCRLRSERDPFLPQTCSHAADTYALSGTTGPSVIVLPQPRDFVELLSERLHALDSDELVEAEGEGDRFQCFKFDEELGCVDEPFHSATDSDSDSSSDDSGVTYNTVQRLQLPRKGRRVRWKADGGECSFKG
ncbi:uncharacterized protein [Littorina saxatilis]|uniref:uncharacterized protein isoform X2 n=1 Tax=Littorina saxatilis TaxID=31220 RepID=UPI0038B4E848